MATVSDSSCTPFLEPPPPTHPGSHHQDESPPAWNATVARLTEYMARNNFEECLNHALELGFNPDWIAPAGKKVKKAKVSDRMAAMKRSHSCIPVQGWECVCVVFVTGVWPRHPLMHYEV